ncbi:MULTISPECIES: CvfD/Ygs/GSP13 family RNA-binding post-transcriptional regulator [Carnobacterium]|jgi:general stress protein 13|uniref:S1 RNA binding domain protein n=2 Tax=Carnobacterium maltaromaticum TaxID=2751 RepID=K8E315_CARML|nr:CvfD/Ygs/GSP13 family RNA-binding post-transcriptional regulator [Carnobacterium maltaromaticum]AOA01436.1 general stress protein [Carnobacterium maltaromaticum]KRN85181.1 general stress protein 13 [Carnobacterium maltaromaticum]MBC9788935.1 S1 RNA-binding domain-containing protein [Carnobacterium maltaromaticum]MBC9808248.1 S1 RNA-binding domain-containing protein [Carnobacterium maltaromaticum]MCC4313260.1 general stress protein [Carnobacterium maltaromaticum]
MTYKIGMIVKGKVTGIQPYGAFVSLDKDTQGLVHISECKHGFVKNLNEVLQVGEEIEVMVIDIDEYTKKISLSMRSLEQKSTMHYHYKKRKYRPDKADKVGFESLRQMMPKWIEEAKNDEKKRQK